MMILGKSLFFVGLICVLLATALTSKSRSRSGSRSGRPRPSGITDTLLPDTGLEAHCAPCGDIDFGSIEGLDQCNPLLLVAESFGDCRTICEGLASVDIGRSRASRGGSKSAVVDATENCRCLCKSLKLNCPQDSCSRSFQEIQCHNNSQNQRNQRCFERVFENQETYNECVTAHKGDESQLPPSMLENPQLDQTKGVEQCNCVCGFRDRQSESESPTGPTGNTTIGVNKQCLTDCTVKSRKVRHIRRRIGEGKSFEQCASSCRREFRLEEEQTEESTSKSSSSRSRSTKTKSRSFSSRYVSSQDCNCYCSMFHNSCEEEKTTPGTVTIPDLGTGRRKSTSRSDSTNRDSDDTS